MTEKADLDVVILCGGLGTRLRSVLADRPKPMALIHGRPFLDVLVDQVVAHGFRRIVFCTGHHGDWIAEYFGRREDIEAVMSHEPVPLGTGGALRACRHHLGSSAILVLNGDSLCPIDLSSFVAEHRRRAAVATVAVVPADGRSDGGGITLDREGRVTSFHEKAMGAYLNAGMYVLDHAVIGHISGQVPCSLEYEVFPALVGHGLYGSVHCVPLHDIGTPERLSEFQLQYARSHNLHAQALQGGEE